MGSALVDTRTATILLEGLRDPRNDEVWREFDARYRPIILSFSRRLGLAEDDAADVAQETLARFARSYREGNYDRTKGRLRSWIFGIARRCVADAHEDRARRRQARGMSAIAAIPDEDRLNDVWEAEYQRELLDRAVAILREETRMDPRTIDAFSRLAFDRVAPAQVAAEMGLSRNDVYLAKHRCLKRLREILDELNERYEPL
jgi:RNA polymerase sigma factor (sigma-70 family)